MAIIYSLVWFIDLLDSSTLNVALPIIAENFQIATTDAEWAITGFFLSMTLGMTMSSKLGEKYGMRAIFLLSQFLYIASSLGSGFSQTLSLFIVFRLLQGLSAGMAIPLGLSTLMKSMPQSQWAKTTACMNIVTLLAPALGPIYGAYATHLFGWRSIFFIKLPLSFICLILSLRWIKKDDPSRQVRFDWPGFICGSIALSGILWLFSEIGKKDALTLFAIASLSLSAGAFFFHMEKKSQDPLIPLAIFTHRHFAYGNLIQSAANSIFLGAHFLISLYVQQGLGFDLVSTGWIMAAITPGMILAQPIVGKLYNRLGPLPFIRPGLVLLALSTYSFAFTTPSSNPLFIGLLVFCIGLASSLTQTANVSSIFSDIPHKYKGAGSTIYSLCKQISASFGVALSAMILTLGTEYTPLIEGAPNLAVFHVCFIVLGSVPLVALLFCTHIDNQRAVELINRQSIEN